MTTPAVPFPNGYVGWKSLMSILGVCLLTLVNIGWAVLNAHAQTPHRDAVSYREFNKLSDKVDKIQVDIDYLVRNLPRG
jgi:hypothetical protein